MEGLALTITKASAKVSLDIRGTSNRLTPFERLIRDSSREFDRGTQARRFRRTKPRHRFERRTRGRREPDESPKPFERRTPNRPGIALAVSSSEHQSDQLGISESTRTFLIQSLARAICGSHQTPGTHRWNRRRIGK